MANILVEHLPTAVEIDGQVYAIFTDFRDCLRVILAFEDDDLTALEKVGVLLDNLYPELPPDLNAAFALGLKFLNGGESAADEDEETGLRLYSFAKDANLIFAAFRQTHGLDLESVEHLHWWKFLALFMDLGSDTTFCNLVGLRKRLKTGKATKDERQMAHELGDLVDLPEPDTRTPEEREREAEFMQLVAEEKSSVSTPKQPTVDPVIMAELLEQPEIKEQTEQMTPEMLTWFKNLLVSQGIYARYVQERKVN